MHPSSPSADLFQMYLYGSASAEPFFVACFPGELGCTTAHLRRLPRKGRAGGAKNLCSSIACRAQPCQRCTPVLQALIYFRCIFTALLRQSRFCLAGISQRTGEHDCAYPAVAPEGRAGCAFRIIAQASRGRRSRPSDAPQFSKCNSDDCSGADRCQWQMKGSEARAVFCFFKPLQRGLEKAANTTREPAEETGRSCWGRGQQDMRPAQGPK